MKQQQYAQPQSDVADEEYDTEPPRPRSSVKRYQPGDYHQGAPTTPVTQRSSRQLASRPSRTTSASRAGREARTQEFYSGKTERLSPDWQQGSPRQWPSRAVKPQVSRVQWRLQGYHLQPHQRFAMAIGGGMCAALLLLVMGWHLLTLYLNLVGDPLAYTQSANRNAASVTIAGHRAQIYAFVDEQKHLEAIVLPDGGKPQLLTGGIVPFAHPLIAVEQDKNGDVLVTVQGPFDDNWFWPQRSGEQSWVLPVEKGKK